MNLPPLPPLPEPSEMDGSRWGYTDEDMTNHAIDAYNAGLAAGKAVAAAVPEGWKLVPIEPTEEMIDAYVKDPSRFFSARTDWAAMLAAAPEVKPEPTPSKIEKEC